ncbi:protein SCO1/2 [Methylobacterium sp. 174MFSha1.1]|uniref:SCO family protein n=1 Tax=Methylobacterium sp. 174MFSha1.1 TaxID=1502749 RepID=UPI0008EFDB61|nr:SCO family protein [Methylobacterium sp. 174MFSha1.1]SFU48858.1 protein SCO1/2 [Methylobacterium sp. 174MFSha1.1]
MVSLRPVLAALLVGLGLAGSGQAAESDPAPPPSVHGGLVAGHFRLIAPDGATVDTDERAGKPYVVVFGFTHCPDVCPTTLAELSLAIPKLPASAKDLAFYFVTVDPERDTPEVLGRYMQSFDPRITGLSGARPAIEEATRGFGVVAQRTDLTDGAYVYGHTAALVLVDGDGLVVDRLPPGLGPDALAARLAALAAGTSPAAALTR